MSADTVRAVLLKPGDVLLIGNVGELTPEDAEAAGHLASQLCTALGLAHVVLFHEDIDLAVAAPSSTEAERGQ
ncbi:hypothetical protein [Streptomyces achromogenes]|uniref:hypothetical protein n=1 Tax=Streptomyces achromogenes TaxID=67255 RepID=UPI003433A67B